MHRFCTIASPCPQGRHRQARGGLVREVQARHRPFARTCRVRCPRQSPCAFRFRRRLSSCRRRLRDLGIPDHHHPSARDRRGPLFAGPVLRAACAANPARAVRGHRHLLCLRLVFSCRRTIRQPGRECGGHPGFRVEPLVHGPVDRLFAVTPETQPLMHTWSLGVEEQSYFVFPLSAGDAPPLVGTHPCRSVPGQFRGQPLGGAHAARDGVLLHAGAGLGAGAACGGRCGARAVTAVCPPRC